MPLEERDTPVVHPHGFDEPVTSLVHALPSPFAGFLRVVPRFHRQLELFRHSVNDPSYTRTRGYLNRSCNAKYTWLDSSRHYSRR